MDDLVQGVPQQNPSQNMNFYTDICSMNLIP